MTYERTVAAAVAETKSKFVLAEALAEDIPRRKSGPTDEAEISEELAGARQEIIDAGGEPRTVATLADYRKTALWIQGVNAPNYGWIPDISFTAHNEARKAGWSYDEFAANPLNTHEIRKLAGRAPSTYRAPEYELQSWSPEEKVAVARQLTADPAVAAQVVSDKQARAAVSRATDDYYQRQATQRAQRTERKAADDSTDGRMDSLLWVNRLGEAHERYSREVNEALRHVGELPEAEQYWLTGAVDRAEASLRASRRYLELGKTEFDAELEHLLKNGA